MNAGALSDGTIQRLLNLQAKTWQPTEWMVHHTYRTLLRDGDNGVDGGAHTGLHSEGMARYTPSGTVYAFEPNPLILPTLRNNLNDSGLSNIVLFESALADAFGVMTFLSHKTSSPLSGLFVSPGRSEEEYEKHTVVSVSLDMALEKSGPIRFIKLDLEGHELFCLYGAWGIIKYNRPYITFEYGRTHDPLGGEADIFGFLRGLGYAIFDPFFRPYGPDYFKHFADDARIFPMNFVACPIERLDELATATMQIASELESLPNDVILAAVASNFRRTS